MNKLKEKLALWVGFEHEVCSSVKRGHCWVDPLEGGHEEEPPNFPESLDACFEWLVPKLFEKGYWIKADHSHSQYHSESHTYTLGRHIFTGSEVTVSNEKPAVAFCLAVEQLIDGEKK